MLQRLPLKNVVQHLLRRNGAPTGLAVDEDGSEVIVHYPGESLALTPIKSSDGSLPRERHDFRLDDCRHLLEALFAVEQTTWQGREALRVKERS